MLKRILNNQFYKTVFYNGLIVLFKLLSAFITSKVSAIYLGPSGYALVGNLKNFIQGILGFTTTGFESGTIRYLSENQLDDNKQKTVVVNVIVLSFIISVVITPFVFLFSESLAVFILKSDNFSSVFKFSAIVLPVISFSWLVLYIINGYQKLKLYTLLLVVFNIVNALVTFILIFIYGLDGALWACFIVPFLNVIVALLFKDIRVLVVNVCENLKSVSLKYFKSISVYILMAIYSSLLISMSYLLIRNQIIDLLDTRNAGLWEAMNKISSFYMLFFSSLFTLYLLPRLSKNKTVDGYYKIMKEYFKFLAPLLVVFFTLLYLFRVFAIKIFLTNDFVEVGQYFHLQLIADAIKVIGFSFAYQFHAKRMVLSYLLSDAVFYGLFLYLSFYLIPIYGLRGVFYGYLLSTVFFLIVVILSLYRTRFKYLLYKNES